MILLKSRYRLSERMVSWDVVLVKEVHTKFRDLVFLD
jgi:hypothetical protein